MLLKIFYITAMCGNGCNRGYNNYGYNNYGYNNYGYNNNNGYGGCNRGNGCGGYNRGNGREIIVKVVVDEPNCCYGNRFNGRWGNRGSFY